MKITIGNLGSVNDPEVAAGQEEQQVDSQETPTVTQDGTSEATETDEGTDGTETESKPEEPKPQLAPVTLTSGVITYGKTATMKCIDCGNERTIKPQDMFQVKRCPDCQRKFRNKQRAQYRKNKRIKEREQEATQGQDA